MKKTSHLFTLLFLLFLQSANAQSWQWLHNPGCSGGFDEVSDFTIDDQGYIYMLGEFSCNGTIIDTTFAVTGPNNDSDIFLAKLNPDGSPVWIKRYGSFDNEHPQSIKVDKAGNLYMAGIFLGSTTIGGVGVTAVSGGSYGSFICKLDNNGDFIWLTQPKHQDLFTWIETWDMTIDNQANVYITGAYDGKMLIDQTAYESENNSRDIFVAKLDSSAQWIWSTTVPGMWEEYARTIKVDEQQNVYIAGEHSGDMDFGIVDFTEEYDYEGFIAKLDADGAFVWAKLSPQVKAIDIDKDANIYITGNLEGDLILGQDTVCGIYGAQQTFMARMNNDGNYAWAKAPDSWNYAHWGTTVHVAEDNSVIFAGQHNRDMDFDGLQLLGTNYENGYIASTDLNGNWLQVLRIGGANMELTPSEVQDYGDGFIAAGIYSGNSNFPPNYSFNHLWNGFIMSTETGFTTSLSELKEDEPCSIEVMPNPALNHWQLHLQQYSREALAEMSYLIQDVQGRKIHAAKGASMLKPISCEHLENGIYYLRLSGNKSNTIEVIKLVKQ